MEINLITTDKENQVYTFTDKDGVINEVPFGEHQKGLAIRCASRHWVYMHSKEIYRLAADAETNFRKHAETRDLPLLPLIDRIWRGAVTAAAYESEQIQTSDLFVFKRPASDIPNQVVCRMKAGKTAKVPFYVLERKSWGKGFQRTWSCTCPDHNSGRAFYPLASGGQLNYCKHIFAAAFLLKVGLLSEQWEILKEELDKETLAFEAKFEVTPEKIERIRQQLGVST